MVSQSEEMTGSGEVTRMLVTDDQLDAFIAVGDRQFGLLSGLHAYCNGIPLTLLTAQPLIFKSPRPLWPGVVRVRIFTPDGESVLELTCHVDDDRLTSLPLGLGGNGG